MEHWCKVFAHLCIWFAQQPHQCNGYCSLSFFSFINHIFILLIWLTGKNLATLHIAVVPPKIRCIFRAALSKSYIAGLATLSPCTCNGLTLCVYCLNHSQSSFSFWAECVGDAMNTSNPYSYHGEHTALTMVKAQGGRRAPLRTPCTLGDASPNPYTLHLGGCASQTRCTL